MGVWGIKGRLREWQGKDQYQRQEQKARNWHIPVLEVDYFYMRHPFLFYYSFPPYDMIITRTLTPPADEAFEFFAMMKVQGQMRACHCSQSTLEGEGMITLEVTWSASDVVVVLRRER